MAIHHPLHNKGFSLLEVMITAVILSLGLLGLVALQTHSKFASYEARQRTIASWLANDMVERVRINRDSWSASGAVTVNLAANLPRPTCALADGTISGCSAADLRAADLHYWQQALLGVSVSGAASSLNSPVGCVVRRANNVLAVGIFWAGKQALSDGGGAGTAATLINECQLSTTIDAARRQFILTTTL
ncbi:type IV pilus modification protein PilV [Aeromonas sobria]|jgi:type IV pilus assembly protein PilV|uniref:Type IV pilus modification protein PilV n=1 Tax=Aeromonas sobria TaxID=646 RepID=A0A1S2CIJ0_AERSO|nr:type IV pilus modification protein PilV [Aeromonas sobria]MBS4687240.1 type IV pilus modification protein PilV [Aeromonas sobria]OHY88532.1 type IV pilus modification protein PilV [Aeromonas sobria]